MRTDSFAPCGAGAGARLADIAPFFENGAPGGARIAQIDGTQTGGGAFRSDRPCVVALSRARIEAPELIDGHLGALAPDGDPYVAQDDAATADGAVVYVPRGQSLGAPAIVTVAQGAQATALNWRLVIVLEENAEAEVWEEYLTADHGAEGLLNAVVEIHVGVGARLRYVCGQATGPRTLVFATQRARIERAGSLDWIALGFGSSKGRVRMQTILDGEGAAATVTGAYVADGRQHIDYDTTQEHAAADTTSNLSFRGLVSDRASAVWRGMIHVAPQAERTNAFQESRSMLLSSGARADSIPGLEIMASDVRCTHAVAVARVDDSQLFYLTSRGLDPSEARRLIIDGFMEALSPRVPEGALRDAMLRAVARKLDAGAKGL